MSRLHAIVALLVTFVVPAYSWHDGSGWLAWTMFSRSQTYRLAVTVTDVRGGVHLINPTELARLAADDVRTYLSGAEHFRHAPVGPAFRRELPLLAHLACRIVEHAARAEVRLDFRRTLDSSVEVSTAETSCDGGDDHDARGVRARKDSI